MPTLKISNSLRDEIRNSLEGCNSAIEAYECLSKSESFVNIIVSIKKLLNDEKYVVVSGFWGLDKSSLETFVRFFGEYYGVVEHTGIKIDCDYTGCASSSLILHNDDAIDLETQPNTGFIQVIREDPVFNVSNGIVLVRELVRKLKFENKELLEKLLRYPIPMLSYGINYEDRTKSKIITEEPVLYKKDNEYRVRFDFYRNKFYYKDANLEQLYEEAKLIYDFLSYAEQVKKNITLMKGDILIHNNKSTLHDRGECSMEIDQSGLLNTREILVSFSR